jgi:glycosyltransferase domain-containing protein
MRNLCIVIPTHERHQYLARCIDYYSKFDCKVIVCDSSVKSYHPPCYANVDYYHLPGQKFAEKVLFALSVSTEDFIALSPDDDFLFEGALYRGLDVLHQQANVQACVGDVLGFPEKPPFKVIARSSGRGVINATSDNPAINIQNYLFNYHQILWSLFRRETLKISFELLKEAAFVNENFFEITLATICAGKGGIYYLEDDWILRELSESVHWGSKHEALTQVKNFWANPDAARFKQLIDGELFHGAAELALTSYLNGQKKNRLSFMRRVAGYIRRRLKIKNIAAPILQEVTTDQRFSPMIKAIEGMN